MSLPPPSATAAVNNCGAYNRGHVGVYFDPSWKVRGSKAGAEIRSPNLCQTHYSDSTFWAMMTDGIGYAQIGWLKHNSGSGVLRYFFEWTRNGSSVAQALWGNPDVGNFIEFRVSRYPDDQHIHMTYNNGVVPPNSQDGDSPETNFDPLDAWVDIHSEWFAEVLDLQDDIAGTSGNHADMFSVESKNAQEEWGTHNIVGFESPQRCFFHRQVGSDSHFETWTAPLDHDC